MADTPHLVLEDLCRGFGGTPVVDRINLSVARGKLIALLGPSGCGKTTTLRMVAGLERPDSGRVLVDGRDVTALPSYHRRMGVVFQSYALFPHMTASANIAFGLQMQGVGRADRRRRVAAALAMVGLPNHGNAKPRTLSGGQQQRVALARALAIEPDVLLLDEPLSALDAKLREELRAEMRAIQLRVGATALFVTHDQAEALAMADLVAVMDHGRIAQLGPPDEVFEHPATPFVARFVGRSARFEGQWDAEGIRVGNMLLRTGGAAGQGTAQIFVRPHHISLLGSDTVADNTFEGRVSAVDYLGEVAHVTVQTDAGPAPIEMSTRDGAWRDLRAGTQVRIGWSADSTLWFPA
ncbi:ABC transporter ATP-binding protein [Acidisphaera sp. L21]|uniref:ABC transporter ATP-binding protein n=1 Tax=Acidisphaera sp. L21 TaxID=1641851 RepID=UPI00131B0448|nr:ABC transporter ATP-binding protein [Acidisphaera sp. L21]